MPMMLTIAGLKPELADERLWSRDKEHEQIKGTSLNNNNR